MKNTVILVFYIGVGDMPKDHVDEYVQSIVKKTKLNSKQFLCYYIPVYNSDSHIECIYPKFVANQELVDKMITLLESINSNFKTIADNGTSKENS